MITLCSFIIASPNGNTVSPFHDIPLFANAEKTVMNMVVKIPRWTNSKMEVQIVYWLCDFVALLLYKKNYREV